jgi:hypothetical protein
MIRSIIKLASLLSGLLTLFMIVVFTISYDESQLQAFMTASENCTGPCLLGIRPSKVTVNDTMQILESHPWVESARLSASGNGYGQIRWQWSGQQPAMIDASYAGRITFYWETDDPNPPSLDNTIIQTISIQTYLRMYSLQDWYGMPNSGTTNLRADMVLGYSAGYHNPGTTISVSSIMPCPVNFLSYWNTRTLITVSIGWGTSIYTPPFEMVKLC